MSIGVAIGKGAGAGVLIKSAEALERMEKVDTLVVDKTGALTEGKPRVTAVVAAPGLSEAEILPLAASLERSSEHPLAAAIVMAAKDRGMATNEPTEFTSVTGEGGAGKIDGRPVALSNARWPGLGSTSEVSPAGRTSFATTAPPPCFWPSTANPAASSPSADPIKPTTLAALDTLGNDGVRIVMLTGDNQTTAAAVAAKLGIKDIEADVLPQDKNRIVKKLTSEGRIFAMAGKAYRHGVWITWTVRCESDAKRARRHL